jgi:hypothetical protein
MVGLRSKLLIEGICKQTNVLHRDGFFEKVNSSTGFHPPLSRNKTRGPRLKELPTFLEEDIERLTPGYLELYQNRIQ